jgi:uncharacterized SAM-binding protein YcdF (DUF218 family)
MEIAFLLKKLIAQLIIPPFNLLLFALLGLLLMKRWPRLGRTLTWSSLLGILLLATPAVAGFLLRSLDVPSVSNLTANNSAQAIVILGGGLRMNTPEYGDTLTHFTLDRVRYGATLARQTNLPVLVSGGAVFVGPPEAEVMASVLRNEFNVPVRWIEKQSRDTEDNLNFSGEMLKAENIRTVILVTHDFHMRRALAHCEAAGLTCIPAPVSYGGRGRGGPWISHLPNTGALETSALAIHEMFGNLALVLRGK